MRSFLLVGVIVAAIASSPATQGATRERLFRKLDWRDGLPVTAVRSVAQDADGFLWIATRGGVARFDGTRVQIVDRGNSEFLPGSGPHGIFWRSEPRGGISRAEGDRGVQVAGPAGAPVSDATSGVIASDGALWLVLEDRLWREDPEGTWRPFDFPSTSGERLRALRPGRNGQVLLSVGDRVRLAGADGSLSTLATGAASEAAVALEDGRFLLGTRDGRLLEIGPQRDRVIATGLGRVLDIVTRGGAWWILSERALTVVRPDRPPESVGVSAGWIGSGALLLDRDGGLWSGTAHGLLHFPEPDTVAWSFVSATADLGSVDGAGAVLFSPAGVASPVLFRRGPAGWLPTSLELSSTEPGCLGPDGRVWIVEPGALVERAAGGAVRRERIAGLASAGRCATGSDRSRWIGTNVGILRVAAGVAPRVLAVPFGGGSIALYETSRGELLAGPASDAVVCRAPIERVDSSPAPWVCETVDGAGRFDDFIELPSGDVWAATTSRGVLRLKNGAWEPLAGLLSDREISGFARAADGGVWVVGPGLVVRAVERPGEPAGWEAVETLGAWQGLPSVNIADVAEADDGRLWLAAPGSVIEVPRSARSAALLPPKVELVEVTVDGEVVRTAGPLELPRGWRRMSLRFAAMSYRDPSLLRYRIRLSPSEPWQAPTAIPLFRFTATSPGDYDVEVQSSLDLRRWSESPARFRFSVPRPWYLSPWFLIAAAVVAGTAVFALARARLALERRLARQRARIARDLHDHLGSGLGSIGLLAGIVSRPDVPPERRASLGSQIRSVAAELSTALSDIVWSLKPGEATLESLTRHLVERGAALFPGDRPRLQVDVPARLPHQRISLAVRRNVLLIALEALHNAARHSGAATVRLKLVPAKRGYALSILDDGKGMEDPAPTDRPTGEREPGGMGLLNMRLRAKEIRAELTWIAPPQGGTEVRLVFSPRAEGRMGDEESPVA